jgi:hypothetical protein
MLRFGGKMKDFEIKNSAGGFRDEGILEIRDGNVGEYANEMIEEIIELNIVKANGENTLEA